MNDRIKFHKIVIVVSLFCLFVENKRKRNLSAKDFGCVACSTMKRRCDVVIFVKKDYDLQLESVQKVVSKCNEEKQNNVIYVCRSCRYNLKGLSKESENTDIKDASKETVYVCTCCHSSFKRQKQVIFFKRKNYDFENKCVQVALSEDVRCKNSIYEHICKNCHYQLRQKKNVVPRIPENAYCRSKNPEKFCKGCKSSDSKGLQGEKKKQSGVSRGTGYWSDILETMGEKTSFDDLKSYVDTLELPVLGRNFKGLRQVSNEKRDNLAFSRIPNDVGASKEDLVPVLTSGGGSCFYYSLSRLVYGDESHCKEMRVRVIVEGIRNMGLYLNHDYLCRGYDFPYGSETCLPEIYATYSSFYNPVVDLNAEIVVEYYKREMFNLRRFSCESGIWQFHQAANVLGCQVQSVYPHVPLENLRRDFHRIILPRNLDEAGTMVRIMWTMCTWNSSRFGHFVPLVERDYSLEITDENLCPVGYVESQPTFAEIDLTEVDDVHGNREHVGDVSMDLPKENHCRKGEKSYLENVNITDSGCRESGSNGNEDAKKKLFQEEVCSKINRNEERFSGFLCTSCHRNKSLRTDVLMFEVTKYNFEYDVVRNVLADIYRCKDANGIEYICKTCHISLSDLKNPDIPRYSAYRRNEEKKKNEKEEDKSYICTSCHDVRCTRKRMVPFVIKEYNFDHDIVSKVLSEKYRCKCPDGSEFICDTCHSLLIDVHPKLPKKCAYNMEMVGKIDISKVRAQNEEDKRRLLIERAGEKFKEMAKKIPDTVCTSCHRLLFKKSTKVFDRNKYRSDGVCGRVLSDTYRYKDMETNEEYICVTCDKDLKKGKMPVQAVANGLDLPEIPPELQGLTRLECRCISLRIPFMHIRALPRGGRGKIRGPCVNVPATLEPISHILPRVPENMDLVFLKFKRIITYKNNYMRDYIRPYKVMAALHWLKENNPHYEDVLIDTNWLKRFEHQAIFEHIIEEDEGESGDLKGDEKREEDGEGKLEVHEDQKGVNSRKNSNKKHVEEEMDIDSGEIKKNNRRDIKDQDNQESDSEDSEIGEDENLEEAQKDYDRRADITIGSTSTCLQFIDPDEVAFSIAPGQDAIPKFILMDDDFEVLSFPNLFPKGVGGHGVNTPRERDICLRRYVNQRLLNKDPRFSKSIEYIFAFQYATELKQLRTDMAMALKRQCTDGKRITVGDMRNFHKVNQMIWKDIAYKFMKKVRGTPSYWTVALYDTLAMLRTFGTPTWFISLSPAEFLWPEFMQAVGRKIGKKWSEEDVSRMEWITKAEHFRENPVPVDQMFESRIESFFRYFLLSKANPLGPISEYIQKIEFQVRGTPHAHCLLWVKDAPRVDENSDEEVCEFVDRYINGKIPCDIPENEDIRSLVLKLQTHSHSPCCRSHAKGKCRFHFPRPPSTKTIIARGVGDEKNVNIDEKDRRHIMELVHERIEEGNGASLKEILESESIPEDMYLQALKMSQGARGTSIVLERDIVDCKTNNCNLDCLKLWRANMDIQYVADPYSCIMYVLSYVMKCENGMSEILKRVAKEFKDQSVRDQMKKILSTFANKREVSVHEAVKRVLSQWLFKKSRTVINISNHPAEERHRMPKSEFELAGKEDDDEDVFMASVHDRYAARPDEMENVCLAQFATQYTTCSAENKKAILLKDDQLGCVMRRTKDTVMRTHRFSDDDYRYYYSKLLLFLPWRKEDFLEGYESYEEHYNDVKDLIESNAYPFRMNSEDIIDGALSEYMNHPTTGPEWHESGSVEKENNEDDEIVDENADKELGEGKGDGQEEKRDFESPLSLKYKAEAIKDTMSAEEYCVMMRNLNEEQREIVMFNRRWMKETIVKLKRGEIPESYKIFLSGPGGTGKSYVINMIRYDNVKLFRRFYISSEDDGIHSCSEDVITLLCAYTGTAAFNINGMTLHSAFQLHSKGISDERKTTMRTRLHRLMQVTVDEISMVGTQMLNLVNNRCCMVKYKNPEGKDFGNINILAVGDLYQLTPVMQTELYKRSYKGAKCASDLAPNLWDNFLLHELTQVMRQRDKDFADMLNVVRVGKPEENSKVDKMLKARELSIKEDDEDYPLDVLHVYAKNLHCKEWNEKMINRLNGMLYITRSEDRLQDVKIDMDQLDLSTLSATETGNLAHTLLLKVGARVFVSNNIDVSDGLTNGVFGTVSHIITTAHQAKNGEMVEEVRVVLVRFDSERVGREARAKSIYKQIDRQAVPISKTEVTFSTRKNGSEINRKRINVIRKQFPLILAWAVTIHKVQGMTMDRIVVDMSQSKGRFQRGQAYVAFSRVRTYEGLNIIGYNRHQIQTCGRVKNEMERLRSERKLPTLPDPMIRSPPVECVSMVHLNVQGLNYRTRSKKTDVQMDKEIQMVDILCLTETHFAVTDAISAKTFWKKKKGEVYRNDRVGRKGGGVAIVVSEKFISNQIAIDSQLEVVGVEVYCPNKVVVLCTYIPPGVSKVAARYHIEKLIGNVLHETDRVIVLGDFNEDILFDQEGKLIHECFMQMGFHQHVTCSTTDYGSLLDHVYTRRIDDIGIDVVDTYYSDHDRVFCFFK